MTTSLWQIDAQANHDSEIYGITITFMLLAFIVVALRFVTIIYFRHHNPAVDDYMIGVALVRAP